MKKYGNVKIPPQKTSWNTTSHIISSYHLLFFKLWLLKGGVSSTNCDSSRPKKSQVPSALSHRSCLDQEVHPPRHTSVVLMRYDQGLASTGKGLEGELDLSFCCPQASSFFLLQMADGVQVVLWAGKISFKSQFRHPQKDTALTHLKTFQPRLAPIDRNPWWDDILRFF